MSRILHIQAHSCDCNHITFPNGKEHEGYVPKGLGIGADDGVDLKIDIDTGMVVGWNDDLRKEVLKRQDYVLNVSGEPI